MKHYVLLTFVPGTDVDRAHKIMSETYRQLEAAIPQLHAPKVHKNCVVRELNADVMAEIELDGPEFLETYLKHPLHVAMVEGFKGTLAGRTSFDCE